MKKITLFVLASVFVLSLMACTGEEVINEIIPPTNLTLSTDTLRLKVGENINLSASFEPENADPTAIIWESFNQSIAFVNQNGRVEARAPGITTVIARSDTLVSSVEVFVGYPVQFNTNGGDFIESIWYYENKIESPPTPTKLGHTFMGWYLDNDLNIPHSANTSIDNHSILHAAWDINSYNLIIQPSDEYQLFSSDGENEKIIQIDFSQEFSSALTSAGRLFMWGDLSNYYLENRSSLEDFKTPFDVTDYFNLGENDFIVEILGTNSNSIVVKTNQNKIFMWGNLLSYLNLLSQRNLPLDVTNKLLNDGEKINRLEIYGVGLLYLTDQSRVLYLGSNHFFPANLNVEPNDRPVELNEKFNLLSNERIIDGSLGSAHLIFLTSLGRVITVGNNHHGQLGLEDFSTNRVLNNVSYDFSSPSGGQVSEVMGFWGHSSILTTDNRLFSFGYAWAGGIMGENSHVPQEITNLIGLFEGERIVQIESYNFHTLLRTSLGRVFSWGWDAHNQLGNSNNSNNNNIKQVIFPNSDLLKDEFFIDIAVGFGHSGGLTKEGKLYTWGRNFSGELGNGSALRTENFYEINKMFDLERENVDFSQDFDFNTHLNINVEAYKKGFEFNGWYTDENFNEPLLESNIPAENLNLYPLFEPITYELIVKTYAENLTSSSFGLHGSLIDSEIIDFRIGETSLLITDKNEVITFGANNFGQLGMGFSTNHPTNHSPQNPIISQLVNSEESIRIVAGGNSIGLLTQKGSLIVWGNNQNNRLGVAGTNHIFQPLNITEQFNLDPSDKLIEIAFAEGGMSNSMALSSTGRVFEWGQRILSSNLESSQEDNHLPKEITDQFMLNSAEKITMIRRNLSKGFILTSANNLYEWNLFNSKQFTNLTQLMPLNANEEIIKLSLEWNCSYALTSQGRVFAWGGLCNFGSNQSIDRPIDIRDYLELAEDEIVADIVSGNDHTVFHVRKVNSESERILIRGQRVHHFIPLEAYSSQIIYDITESFNLVDNETIISIAAGHQSSMILTSKGRLYTWGSNNNGQLGTSNTVSVYSPIPIINFDFEEVQKFNLLFNASIPNYRPFKQNHIFAGYYLDKEFLKPFTLTTMPAEDITLYARWIPID